jgi:predicted kinase
VSGLVVLFCGYSFSGKSTLAAALHERLGAAVVCPDAINARRGLWGGDGVPDSEWGRTLDEAHAELEALLAAGTPLVVIDDTCCYRWLRDGYREIARRHGHAVELVVLDVPAAEVEARMARAAADPDARRGLKAEVWASHRDTFEWPTDDEGPRRFTASVDLTDRVVADLGLG